MNTSGRPNSIYAQSADHRNKPRKGLPSLLVCPDCGYIKAEKRWHWDHEVHEADKEVFTEQRCPGCEAIKNKWPEGEITLTNKIISLVPGQIESLIRNLEEQFRHDDPKNRILQIRKFKNQWKVYTTSVFLARRIGEVLESTYQSKTTYKFSKGEKYIQVLWE